VITRSFVTILHPYAFQTKEAFRSEEPIMTTQDLVFYSSENGDDWLLVEGEQGKVVRH
jgi:hypothetical protein